MIKEHSGKERKQKLNLNIYKELEG